MLINILAVGDICGVPGLQFLENHLKDFKKAHDIAFAVVNGENANVVGITPKQAEQIFRVVPSMNLKIQFTQNFGRCRMRHRYFRDIWVLRT